MSIVHYSDRLLPNWMVYWAGFEAPMHRLGRNGWNVAVSRNDYDLTVEMVLTLSVPEHRFGSGNIIIASGHVKMREDMFRMERDRPGIPVQIHLNFGSDLYVVDNERGESEYYNGSQPLMYRFISTSPRDYYEKAFEHEETIRKEKLPFESIYDFEPFIYLKNPRDFYIRKASMQDVLDLMLEKQEPSQAEIRKRIIKEKEHARLFAQINLLED